MLNSAYRAARHDRRAKNSMRRDDDWREHQNKIIEAHTRYHRWHYYCTTTIAFSSSVIRQRVEDIGGWNE